MQDDHGHALRMACRRDSISGSVTAEMCHYEPIRPRYNELRPVQSNTVQFIAIDHRCTVNKACLICDLRSLGSTLLQMISVE